MKNYDFVCVDLGASCTRVGSNDKVVYDIPNNFDFIDVNTKVNVAARRDNDAHVDVVNNLDVTIYKLDGEKTSFFPCRALMGDVANRHAPVCIKPSGQLSKVDQQVNYVSAVVAIAHQILVKGISTEPKVYVDLPPMEVAYNSEKFITNLSGTYKVIFNMLDKELTFTVPEVTTKEEAFMAMLRFFFNLDGKMTDNGLKYREGYTMMLDIGASTTDIVIAEDGRYVEKSGQTFKTGCNVILANIANAIRARYSYDPTPEELEEILATGRVQRGNTFVEIGDVIRNAKAEFAKSINVMLTEYFRMVNIPMSKIRAIVVASGGSMESSFVKENGEKVVTCEPVSIFITQEINRVVQGIDVVSVEENPRHSNIEGTIIFATLMNQLAASAESAQA